LKVEKLALKEKEQGVKEIRQPGMCLIDGAGEFYHLESEVRNGIYNVKHPHSRKTTSGMYSKGLGNENAGGYSY